MSKGSFKNADDFGKYNYYTYNIKHFLATLDQRMGFYHYLLQPSNSDALKIGHKLLMVPPIGGNFFSKLKTCKKDTKECE